MSLVLEEITNGVGVLTLNHAAKRNAPGSALLAELIGGLEELAVAGVRSVILRAPAGRRCGRRVTTSTSCLCRGGSTALR